MPFLAYGVFNDNGTNDGSYVPAISDSQVDALLGVPVIVEVGDRFSSELMLTNLTDKPAQAYFEFVESLATPGGASTGIFYVDLGPSSRSSSRTSSTSSASPGRRSARGAAPTPDPCRSSFPTATD